ncbi:hypothetical protein [Siminovitchia terrae]|uniref:hypothetical protein n=1 Tax=Siminovitchia terrae TaxID=1914933 RepID=UPI0028B07EBC|nr:hypothetical protein [Siminovitchia terrae]
MHEHIINQIVITVGQWGQFGGQEYEQRFESLLRQLQKATGLDREGAVRFIERQIAGEDAA